jgi:glycosyltransferase involved in cell wall biosynthesis
MSPGPRPLRVAVVCDYPEEHWPSMDLVGEMILTHLHLGQAGAVEAERVCPPFRHRHTRLPVVGRSAAARNADRLVNRFHDYPRVLRRLAGTGRFDLYHLVDHSYSQLVHALPPGRAVVTCHDLDTFRCLFEPALEPRSRWFRAMAGRILSGLKRAAAIACDGVATRDALAARGVIAADRLHVVPLGLSPEFTADPDPRHDAEAARLLGPAGPADLLHVGSNIPRKRIDVLLSVFATVRQARPGARLIKVGGPLPPDLDQKARDLGVSDAVVTLPFLDRHVLAAVYRRAALVLLPSDAEGFGLPVVEALSCGAPLLASDLPVLRAVAGDAATYRPVGDVAAWSAAALTLLDEPRHAPAASAARRAAGQGRGHLFSWSAHADRLMAIYHEVISRPDAAPPGATSVTIPTRRLPPT